MVKRKIWMILLVLVMFFGIGFKNKVIAVASCSCNANSLIPYDKGGYRRANGQLDPSVITSNNCPAKATYTLSTPPREEGVFPICIKDGNYWGCHCFADYTSGDITQIPGFTYDGAPTGGTATECKAGSNCCVCGLDSSLNTSKLIDNCDSSMTSQCAGTIDMSAYSNNCSCIEKPVVAEASSKNYDPFTGCENSEINTALGCVPVEMNQFIPWLLKYLFGIAGGIAFLLMAYGFILIATSGGDEKKMAGAKETITSAIIGLLVCIFAIFILRLIAVNILQIPGI